MLGENSQFKKIGVAVFCLFILVLSVSFAVDIPNKIKSGKYIGQDIERKNIITVSETGEVFAKPDLFTVSLTVVNEAKTVSQAMAENTQKMNSVISFVKSQGIEDKDLKTTSFFIYPRYEYENRETCFYPPCPSDKRILVGYEITQTLEVKIRDAAKIGKVLEGATEAGANQVGDLRFTIEKEDELKIEARKQAIEKAKNEAKELASQLGVNLGKITNFSESGSSPIFYYAEKAVGMGGAAPDIQVGENKISVTVSISYEIQ